MGFRPSLLTPSPNWVTQTHWPLISLCNLPHHKGRASNLRTKTVYAMSSCLPQWALRRLSLIWESSCSRSHFNVNHVPAAERLTMGWLRVRCQLQWHRRGMLWMAWLRELAKWQKQDLPHSAGLFEMHQWKCFYTHPQPYIVPATIHFQFGIQPTWMQWSCAKWISTSSFVATTFQ